MKNSKKLIFISLGLIFYISFILISDIDKISKNVFSIKVEFLIIILGIQFFGFFLRGIRQYQIIKQLDIKIKFLDNLKIFFASLALIVTPGGSGILIKSELFKNKFNISRSKTLPIVYIERIQDLLATIIILLFTLIFIQTFLSIIAITICFFIVGISMIAIKQKKIIKNMIKKISKIKIFKKIIPNEEFDESLKKLLTIKKISNNILISIIIWIVELAGVYFTFIMFGLDWYPITIFQNYLISIILGGISMIPGGIGVAETSLVAQISTITELSLATSLVLFIRFTTIWFATIVGIIFLKLIINERNHKI